MAQGTAIVSPIGIVVMVGLGDNACRWAAGDLTCPSIDFTVRKSHRHLSEQPGPPLGNFRRCRNPTVRNLVKESMAWDFQLVWEAFLFQLL